VPCLRSKTAAAVQAASAGTGAFTANIGGHLMPRAPIEAIASGAAIRIPVMVGANHDEQRRNPLSITGFPATRATYEKYLTTTFGPLGSVIGAEYAADTFPDPAYAAGAIASDSGIPNGIGVCPMLAELGSALSKVTTTFVYELDDPHGSVAQGFPGFEAGSLHTAEVPILYAAAPAARTAEQAKMADRMKRYWATFAQSGKPTGGTLEWSQVTAGNKSTVMRFQPEGDAVVPWEQMVAEHHCAFWAQLGY
jgi:para-nitrobenzyl esterase